MSITKIKIRSHNTKLYPICIVGAGLAGKALAHLLTLNKQKFCIIEAQPSLTYQKPYVSTGFIQNKTLKLIKKFFCQQPPITNTINSFNIFGKYIPNILNFQTKKPLGYMLNLNTFLKNLKITPQKIYTETYIVNIQQYQDSIQIKLNNKATLNIQKLIIADGAISNTSQTLKKQGLKVNVNNKFIQGAEAIVRLNSKIIHNNILKNIQNKIFFGIYPEYKGYGMWIAPFGKFLKIGFAVNQNFIIKRKINIGNLMNHTIQKAKKILKLNDLKIIHTGYKLIPIITAAQLHNITPYKNIWQIGDAGGFVGPLLLDGIYPGLNSVVDTYLELTTTIQQPALAKNMPWSAKSPIPGNSKYTISLLKYMTLSAILRELYDIIFANKIILFIASKFLQLFYKPLLYLFFKYKKEI